MNSIKPAELQGCYTALITPMRENKYIDYKKLDRLIYDQVETSITGILACGTTGQSAALSHKEHVDLADHIFHYLDGRKQYIASAGSNSTREAIDLSNAIEERIGPTTFLHVTGYYNNPPQEGLLQHYRKIAKKIHKDSNMILYNVPGRTSSNIEPETAIELAQNPKIIGIKEASGDMQQVERIIRKTDPKNFRVLSGEDNLVTKIIHEGGYGVISASANIAPEYFAKLARLSLSEYDVEARVMQQRIIPLVNAVFSAKNPIPLAQMFETNVRLPLVNLPGLMPKIRQALSNYTVEELGIDLKKYQEVN
jgi:4-hydroxy-tetrahydrodipicolinate synthase